jgi:type I restriction enzyme S subunit
MFDESGKYKLVTIKNVQDGHFVSECTDSLSVTPKKMPDHCHLKDGDILLSLTGNVGRVCIVTGENYLLNQRVAVLNPIGEQNRAFTYLLFRQKDFQNTLMGISRGTAQQNLSPIETKSLEIIIPSDSVLNDFSRVANPIFDMLVSNIKQNSNFTALRDSLLPRLMNGKIRV